MALLEQNLSEVTIFILDNASPIPVAQVLSDLNAPALQIVRSDVNIGANGNIMKCYTVCNADWLWILGDDDYIAPDAIQTIRTAIAGASDETCLINFSIADWCDHPFEENLNTYNLLLEKFGNSSVVGNCLCISTSVCRRSHYLDYIKMGYHCITTCAPHLVMTMLSVKAGNAVLLTPRSIITHKDLPSDTYAKIVVMTGVYSFLDISPLKNKRLTNAVNALADNFLVYSKLELAAIVSDAKKEDFKYWIYFFLKTAFFQRWRKKLRFFNFAVIACLCRVLPVAQLLLKKMVARRLGNWNQADLYRRL